MFATFEAQVNGEVRVFGTVIPQALHDRDVFEWLSAEEAQRASAMQSRRRRAQFAAGRWLLHHAAARVFGAHGYRFHAVRGRPVIAAADGSPAAASLSHSADMVLCAAARVQALGVDVERIRPRQDWAALSGFALHPSERIGLEGAADAVRWERFYRAWTCKEALAKALGVGVFALHFDRIAIAEGIRDWHIHELSVGRGFAAAVAWRA